MTFQVPKSQASINQNRFQFQFPGEKKTYSVPLLKYLKPSLAMKLDDLTPAEAVAALFDLYFPNQDLFAKFEDGEQFNAFMEAWSEESGVSMGESVGSADS